MKRILKIIILLTAGLFLTGCQHTEIRNDTSPEEQIQINPSALDMQNVMFWIFRFNAREYDGTVSHMLILENGAVWTGDTLTVENHRDFCLNMNALDNSAFQFLEHTEQIGTIPEETMQKLHDLTIQIDPGSECYDRDIQDMGKAPSVLPGEHFVTSCIIRNAENKREVFRIISRDTNQGADYDTYDENAKNAYYLLIEESLLDAWH